MVPPTSNNGSVFYNRNTCSSFNLTIDTNLKALSSVVCGEVTIYNSGSNSVLLFDNGLSAGSSAFIVAPSATVVMRGLTNSAQVSAKATTGSCLLYCRTQFYSFSISQ